MGCRLLRLTAVAIVVPLAGIQAVRPQRTNPATPASTALEAQTGVPADIRAILTRACSDCHSNLTRWPWYSNVAPVSWFVIGHVNHGRRHVNFSEWANYDSTRRTGIVTGICDHASRGTMPLRSYLLIHHDATLSPEDVRALCEWTKQLR